MTLEMKDLTQHSERVRDQRIEQVVPLVAPAQIVDELPLTPRHEEVVLSGRAAVSEILRRADDRLWWSSVHAACTTPTPHSTTRSG